MASPAPVPEEVDVATLDPDAPSVRHAMYNTLEPAPDTLLYRDYAKSVRPTAMDLILRQGAKTQRVVDLNRKMDEEKGDNKKLYGMLVSSPGASLTSLAC